MNFREIYLKREQLISEFKKVFHKELPWDLWFLFDVNKILNKISNNIGCSDNSLLSDYIKKEYGEDADNLVSEIVNLALEIAEVMSYSTDAEVKELQNRGLVGIARRLNG